MKRSKNPACPSALGSFSDLDTPKHEVRFAAKSGHRPAAVALMVALAVG